MKIPKPDDEIDEKIEEKNVENCRFKQGGVRMVLYCQLVYRIESVTDARVIYRRW